MRAWERFRYWLWKVIFTVKPLEYLDTCPVCGLTDGWHQYTDQ